MGDIAMKKNYIEKNYAVYCYDCRMIVDLGRTRKIAQALAVQHILNSPHMFVSVFDRQEAEEKGIPWPRGQT